MTSEYAAVGDAQALASLCEHVKVKVDVTEKLSYGTLPVHADLGGMLKMAHRALGQMRPDRPQREEIRLYESLW